MEFYRITFKNNEQCVFELNTNILQKEDGTHCNCETVNVGDKIFYKNGFREITGRWNLKMESIYNKREFALWVCNTFGEDAKYTIDQNQDILLCDKDRTLNCNDRETIAYVNKLINKQYPNVNENILKIRLGETYNGEQGIIFVR